VQSEFFSTLLQGAQRYGAEHSENRVSLRPQAVSEIAL